MMRKLSFREMPKGTQAIVSKDEIQTSFQVQHASNCSTLPIERYKYLRGCHDRAVLLYEYVGKRIVDLQHTEVPDAYRGRGIAKHLAKGKRFKGLEILPENFQSYNSLGTEQTEQPKEGLDTTHTSFSPVTPAFLFS
ncbi:protein NATD1 isoform X1 [Sarcophilus harrisii]|uniref:protein NATD1 isoform X1 n=1 Tax=Sarcophilus harrisii TaxID=9305 RepID=UPI001301CF57|nr:protein NATD1 isoform X1 [Sarcophilus harrisii]